MLTPGSRVILFALLISLASCDRPPIHRAKFNIEPYTNPVRENSIILTVDEAADQPMGFSVVIGSNVTDLLMVGATDKDELSEVIVAKINKMLKASKPSA